MTVDKKKKKKGNGKDRKTLTTAPWCGHHCIYTLECFQCVRTEGLPGVLVNKGTKEKYRREQGKENLFYGMWEQPNLY